MHKWKITIGQLTPALLDPKKNAMTALSMLDKCAMDGSSLLLLPELYLTGYEIRDAIQSQAERDRIKMDIDASLSLIADKTAKSGVDILISYPLFVADSDRPFIALDYISDGRVVARHRKINLCNYAQYTEHLVFQAGDAVTVANMRHGKGGMFICEDLWHMTNAIFAAKLGAEVIFYPSAATVLRPEEAVQCLNNWKKLTVGTAFSQTSYVVCCNHAASGNVMYFGGSHVVDPNGEIILEMPLFEESIMDVTLDMDHLNEIRAKRPLLKNERFSVYSNYL